MSANGRPVCVAVSLLLALLISAQPGLTLFFRDMNAAGFNDGNFQDAIYNSSIGAVALNWSDATNKTYVLSGNFTSRIFVAGSVMGLAKKSFAEGPGVLVGAH
ncbi:MAG TPA: hypothetical protein VM238_03275 [Phycisphaerae bacterium]|nr:hypothetical protein [Phycisphaerae bacterium]